MSLIDQDKSSSFDQIPVIDITAAYSQDPDARKLLAQKIQDACINVGFFYVAGHQISESTIQSAIAAGRSFFNLPVEEKAKLDIHKSLNFKGYTALLSENTDTQHGKGDLHEGFDIGYEPLLSQDSKKAERTGSMSGDNVWPPPDVDLKNFRQDILTYYHAAHDLGKLLFPLFALALDQPETFFDDKTTESAAIMRVLRYPSQDPTEVHENGEVIGIGAHTDYECFTILWQDSAGGLQAQNASGKWVNAVPISRTFVVNIGDQLARWTNDIFKSTRHRAINISGMERYSMPLFFGTDYDVMLEPISSCIKSGDTPKYEIVKAGDYVRDRLNATYTT